MYDTLKRQDYLYTLLTRGNNGSEARVVQSIVGFLHVPEAPEAALQRLEKEDIRILSLTVTEKGYYRTPDGGLDARSRRPVRLRERRYRDRDAPRRSTTRWSRKT